MKKITFIFLVLIIIGLIGSTTRAASVNPGQLMPSVPVTSIQKSTGGVIGLRQKMQQKQQELGEELKTMGKGQQEVYQNQNQVRLAVYTLLTMKDSIGDVGPEASQIAGDLNNSVQETIKAEEKIKTTNGIKRFFLGDDKTAAESLALEVNQNKDRVQQLKQLIGQCQCEEEIKNVFKEQVGAIEQEQNRLQAVAEKAEQSKGIIGWVMGLFKR